MMQVNCSKMGRAGSINMSMQEREPINTHHPSRGSAQKLTQLIQGFSER